MLRTFAAVALATSVVAVAAPASAQEAGESNTRRPMGLRFELGWNEELNIATIGNVSTGGPGGAGFTGINRISPNGDIKVGYDIGQFTPLIGLSFANQSIDLDEDTSATAMAFVLDLEARYYLAPHRKGLQPFVFGEFNSAWVSLSRDPELDDDEQDIVDDIADNADYSEVNLGLGMEYKFDGAAFAIGGKWGLGLAWTGGPSGDEELGNSTFATLGAIYGAWRL